MTPQEIQQLLQQSPTLRDAMVTNKATVWRFLRDEVSLQYVLPCEKCEKRTQLLRSPYAQDLCIACLLHELLVGGPLDDVYRDRRSRLYDEKYDRECQFWDDFYTIPADYDGPPIEMA